MILVEQAITKIEQTVVATTKTRQMPLAAALGFVLAIDHHTQIDLPPFRQSAMDGYALCLHQELSYRVVGEVAAGGSANPELKPGEAVRIFTGAPVPDSANSLVIQEVVKRSGDQIELESPPKFEANIRPQGEQLKQGTVALTKGHRLNPASIGLLASAGLNEVLVFAKPKIAVVVTGDELKDPGSDLDHGQIYESNGAMLKAVLQQQGYNQVQVYRASDTLEILKQVLSQALESADVLLVSGGISVGDYDFAQTALGDLGVSEQFYKVNQKPGKPLLFGIKGSKLVFALPGNPASALSCFYRYVLMALQGLEGQAEPIPPLRMAKIKSRFTKKGSRAQFLKAKVTADEIEVLDGQASSMLQSFAYANALAYLKDDVKEVAEGSFIPYLKID